LQKLRSPNFPSAAESSIPFNIHSNFTNQPNSKINYATVNDYQFKPPSTHNGIRISDPLQVPTMLFINPTPLTAKWQNTK
jgi:hypothetical protein